MACVLRYLISYEKAFFRRIFKYFIILLIYHTLYHKTRPSCRAVCRKRRLDKSGKATIIKHRGALRSAVWPRLAKDYRIDNRHLPGRRLSLFTLTCSMKPPIRMVKVTDIWRRPLSGVCSQTAAASQRPPCPLRVAFEKVDLILSNSDNFVNTLAARQSADMRRATNPPLRVEAQRRVLSCSIRQITT